MKRKLETKENITSDKNFMAIYMCVREVNSQHGFRQITRRDNGDAAKNNHV